MARGRWVAVAVVLLAALAVGGWTYRQHQQTETTAANCRAVTTGRSALLQQHPGAPVAVLGDSYAQGSKLPDGAAGAFPALLGRPVQVDGEGSTGFTTSGYCSPRHDTYGDRLAADHLAGRPTVIVEGGVNDALTGDAAAVEAAAGKVLAALRGSRTVIVVGPPTIGAASTATVDAALRRATEHAGRVYVSLLHQPIQIGADGTHPTAAGQRTIAGLVLAALSSAAGTQ